MPRRGNRAVTHGAWGRPLDPDERLIFLHIPKTAGSTLHSILNRQFSPEATHNVFAASTQSEDVQELSRLSDERRRKIKLLKGHQPFGLHRFLPGPSRYTALVREPVARIVSAYHYILQGTDWRREHIEREGWSVADFVESGVSPGMDNGQLRWLTGTLDTVPVGGCNPSLLDDAKEILERHFILVGPNESFGQYVALLSLLCGWPRAPAYRVRNRALKKGARAPLGEGDRDRIRAANRLDVELYEHVVDRFEVLVRSTDGFEERYRELQERRANGWVQTLWNLLPGR